MSETDKLRALLDGRGVEWCEQPGPFPVTAWELGGVTWVGKEYAPGKLSIETRPVTSQQAVDATLGRGECEPIREPLASDFAVFVSYCGNCAYPLTDGWIYCPDCGWKVKR